MTKIYTPFKVGAVFLVVLLLSNCVAVQPFPHAARAGDTITLAVGSFEDMTILNTTVEFVSDEGATAGTIYPVEVGGLRTITKIYPDKTSQVWSGTTNADGIPSSTGHGVWQTVMVIDLPSNLPAVNGHINVSTTADLGANSIFMTDVNNVQIPMEILSGPGTSNDFSYYFIGSTYAGDFSLLEPRKQALVKFDIGNERYGAIEVSVNSIIEDIATGDSIPGYEIQIISDDQPNNIDSQRQTSWSKNGNDITVNVISPNGQLFAMEGRFSIVIPDNAQFVGVPTISSITYYDINGAVVPGSTPSVTLIP